MVSPLKKNFFAASLNFIYKAIKVLQIPEKFITHREAILLNCTLATLFCTSIIFPLRKCCGSVAFWYRSETGSSYRNRILVSKPDPLIETGSSYRNRILVSKPDSLIETGSSYRNQILVSVSWKKNGSWAWPKLEK